VSTPFPIQLSLSNLSLALGALSTCHCSCIPRPLVYVAPSTISRYLDFFSFLYQPNAPLLSFVRSFPRFVVGVLIVNLYRPTHLSNATPHPPQTARFMLYELGTESILWSATGPFSRGKLGRLGEGITGVEWSLDRLSALRGHYYFRVSIASRIVNHCESINPLPDLSRTSARRPPCKSTS
jgi:hypothetical protein